MLQLAILLKSGPGRCGESLDQLKEQLARGVDFRVRVSAALKLGQSRDTTVRAPLELALGDASAAVRAAAAAALQLLGDSRAIPSLRGLASDPSESVKRQAQAAIDALYAANAATLYVVQLGRVRGATGVLTRALELSVYRAAQQNLQDLPGVVFRSQPADTDDDALPVLLFDATLLQLTEEKRGSALAVSARLEFVVSQLPGLVIRGRLSGAASAYGEGSARTRPAELRRLRQEAIEAATESALLNAAGVLRTAVG